MVQTASRPILFETACEERFRKDERCSEDFAGSDQSTEAVNPAAENSAQIEVERRLTRRASRPNGPITFS